MAHSESWAQRLLRGRKSPQELLRRRRYRTPVFLRIYLDHVEEIRFRDPQAALKLARVAPRLARRVPEDAGTGGHREYLENLVRAHAVLAGAYRVTGRDHAAESEYTLAVKIADSGDLSPVARADLNLRRATLGGRGSWTRQQRAKEALELVDAAEAAYRAAQDQRRLAEAHAVRGYVLNEAELFAVAIPYHGKALTLALSLERTKPADPAEGAALARVVKSARLNLAFAVSEAPGAGFAATAFTHIADAYRELRGQREDR
ncbi:MAG: hypothetical protein GY953_02015 [bacterium]|nr:hypothetical protein [bacterium]